MKGKCDHKYKFEIEESTHFSLKEIANTNDGCPFLRFSNLKNDKFQPSDQNSTRQCQSVKNGMNACEFVAYCFMMLNKVYKYVLETKVICNIN